MTEHQIQDAMFLSPHGQPYVMAVRADTSDWNTANACAGSNDEYSIPTGLAGWAVDVGAHIGAWSVPLLMDNPDLRLVAIEALPENVLLLQRNLAVNGLDARAVVVHGAASDTLDPVRISYTEGDDLHEFIGGAGRSGRSVQVPGVTLDRAIELTGAERVAILKSDCEGCEYPFLWGSGLRHVAFITGEHHAGFAPLVVALQDTHTVKIIDGTESFGHFEATLRSYYAALLAPVPGTPE